MQTLSVSMIVKNEPIDRLVMLIDYMRPLASQFVIADTGTEGFSVDRPLLEKAGAKVIDIGWQDDFAWARNQTLAHIGEDWTLHLDADELPSVALIEWIRDHVLTGHIDSRHLGFLVFTRNFWGGDWGVEVDAHWHCRLFRSARGSWYKRVHEQVQLDGRQEPSTRDTLILPRAPKDAYIIHSKPREKIEVSAELYRRLG